jgi:hypothetical protein
VGVLKEEEDGHDEGCRGEYDFHVSEACSKSEECYHCGVPREEQIPARRWWYRWHPDEWINDRNAAGRRIKRKEEQKRYAQKNQDDHRSQNQKKRKWMESNGDEPKDYRRVNEAVGNPFEINRREEGKEGVRESDPATPLDIRQEKTHEDEREKKTNHRSEELIPEEGASPGTSPVLNEFWHTLGLLPFGKFSNDQIVKYYEGIHKIYECQ